MAMIVYRNGPGAESLTASYKLVNENDEPLTNCYLGTHVNNMVISDGHHSSWLPRDSITTSMSDDIGVGFTTGSLPSNDANITNLMNTYSAGYDIIDETYYRTDDRGVIVVVLDEELIRSSLGYNLLIRTRCEHGTAEGTVRLGLAPVGIVDRRDEFTVKMRTIAGDPQSSSNEQWIEEAYRPTSIRADRNGFLPGDKYIFHYSSKISNSYSGE